LPILVTGAALEPRASLNAYEPLADENGDSESTNASDRIGILLVSDNTEQAAEIESILSQPGRDVVCAVSGQDALRRLLEEDFAVILLAANMPDMTGVEATARIRRRRRSELTPILFITGTNGAAQVANIQELPFVDFIPSPIDPHLLRTKISVYVDLFRKTESMRQQAAHRMQLAREQAARQVAEKAMRRWALLAEVSGLLSRSLDFDTTLISLHRALVPALADACQLVLCDTNGDLWFSKTDEHDSSASSGSHGRVQMVDPRLAEAIRDSIATGRARSVAHEIVANAPNIAARKRWSSVTIAPLVARDVPLGAIICCRKDTRRAFTVSDIALVQDLAGRAATALDNAQLYQTIRDGERRKDEFLAMLGHELRNPLAAIINAGELSRLLDPADPSFQETQDIIRQQAALMKRLVDDLLDVSRITSGRVQLQKSVLRAGELVARVAEANNALFTSRNQVLHLSVPDKPIDFQADPCRLAQILSNLLVNASKYTDPGGNIWFSVEREGDEVAFRVKDSGIGIGPDLLPHVFDLFAQANRSLHRSEGGLGIGLTIVKGLADLHGGRVWVDSDGIGRGSQFTVWLPIGRKTSPAGGSRISKNPAAPISGQRLLVVEDQPALLRVTVALLKRLGHQVYAAADGQEALLAVKEFKPDVVLLDIGLPGMDGYAVARTIREEMGDSSPLLVAMTGYGRQEVDRHVGKARFDAHLVKPVDINAIQQLFAKSAAASHNG
jgi:signal transduction histidine kinase/DNA-binding response OmpR family regulator